MYPMYIQGFHKTMGPRVKAYLPLELRRRGAVVVWAAKGRKAVHTEMGRLMLGG